MPIAETFGSVAEQYDAPRRRLVPCFDGFYGAVIDGLREGEPALDVTDLGAGTGLLSELVLHACPDVRLTLVDVSKRMLDVAARRFADDGRVTLLHADYSQADLEPCDAVVSALSIHHLSDEQKRALFARIFAALPSGGLFLNADQVAGVDDADTRRLHQEWEDQCRALGSDEEELAGARLRMQEDQLSPLEDQLTWLREAGFVDVRAVFRHGMFAVYRGARP